MEPLLEARGLTRYFPVRRGLFGAPRAVIRAVEDVDLEVAAGECVGLVGESGSGKSTLGRLLVRLLEPTAGRLYLGGHDLLALTGKALRRRRRDFQIVFQDPYRSLNPRMRVASIVGEPLVIHGLASGKGLRERVADLLELVGLDPGVSNRFPHEFSGGQRQRIGIARALASAPRFVVADEPVSALDVSVQAQIINLMARLRRELGLALLFIAHDLAVVEHLADRVVVMYLGRIVESGPRRAIFSTPMHPYTAGLLAAAPAPDPGRESPAPLISGEPPSAVDPPTGCTFHPRCPIAEERCHRERPPFGEVAPGHRAACHFPGRVGD